MKCEVTREVVTDLLPLYLAGEASPETRTLVDAFLREDLELARRVQAQEEAIASLRIPDPLAMDHEMRTIQRTRRVLRLRGTIMGIAIFLTLVPFSVAIDKGGAHWAWADFPLGAAAASAAALIAWAAYFTLRHRLRAAGV